MIAVSEDLGILPYYCFDVLHAKLKRTEVADVFEGLPDTEYPLFVTWKKKSQTTGEYSLRGCIGTFIPMRLATGTKQFAINSAFNDHRFPKISEKELPLLQCTVSLLVGFKKANHLEDWDVVADGIEISFSVDGEIYRSTYLPGVAHEQGWTRMEAINSLILKADYRGPITKQLTENIEITRYNAAKFQCTYEEYRIFRSST